MAPIAEHDREDEHALVLQPVVVRAFLEHIFERAEEGRHAGKAPPVELLHQRRVGLVEVDQRPGGGRHQDARHDVDQEQPVPGEGMADIAADGRADGRRQRRDEADHRRDDGAPRRREDREGGGEDAGDHAAADETLDRPVDDHLVDVGGGGAQRACRGEARRRDGEQHARRQQPAEEARQRDHHHLGDQIGGLHPRDLVGAGAQAGLDLGQRGRDDLDVEDRHEHAEHHRQEGDGAAQLHRRLDRPGRRADRDRCCRGCHDGSPEAAL